MIGGEKKGIKDPTLKSRHIYLHRDRMKKGINKRGGRRGEGRH